MQKKTWFYALINFLIFSAILSIGLTAIYFFGISQKREAFISTEQAELAMVASSLLEEQSGVLEDLYLLASLQETVKLLRRQPDPNRTVEYASLMLMKSRRKYDQLRILDIDGMERMRVNDNNGTPSIVPESELQDKSKRAYYLEARNLLPGEVYLSPLDLNVEDEKIEIPFKPMLRYVMPVTDQDESIIGYVIINYLADRLMTRAEQVALHQSETHWLLNPEGYYLFGPDPDRLWGFQIPERAGHSLRMEDPELWTLLQNQDSGYLDRKKSFRFFKTVNLTDFSSKFLNALYGYTMRIPSDEKAASRKWYFVMDADKGLWLKETAVLRESILLLGVFGMLMLLAISIIVARITQANREMKEQLVKDATFDELTGAYNRKAGYLLIKTCIENSRRTKETSILCFIDANNLKLINDSFGHELGDRFLVGLVESLKETIRRTDRIIRYGGDEFIALLQKCDEGKAAELLERAKVSLRKKGEAQGSKVPWSFSHGSVVFNGNQPDEADALIRQADALMYRHKQAYKSLNDEAVSLFPR